MEIYARQGFTDFILSVGYRKEVIIDYFYQRNLGWKIEIIDTGPNTDTGGRIWRCRHRVRDTFMATYADGLSDVPLNQLVAYRSKSGALGTITCVPLRSQYGTLTTDGTGRVTEFYEKPVLSEYWINARFFGMNSRIFDHWRGENLEREAFPNLLPGRHLASFRQWRVLQIPRHIQGLAGN